MMERGGEAAVQWAMGLFACLFFPHFFLYSPFSGGWKKKAAAGLLEGFVCVFLGWDDEAAWLCSVRFFSLSPLHLPSAVHAPKMTKTSNRQNNDQIQ
jgi:hypothetical protein